MSEVDLNFAKLSFLNKDFLLFYRGQKNDYRNKANNSTFYPTIYRGEYLTQAELDYRFDKLESASKILVDLLSTNKIDGISEIKRKTNSESFANAWIILLLIFNSEKKNFSFLNIINLIHHFIIFILFFYFFLIYFIINFLIIIIFLLY